MMIRRSRAVPSDFDVPQLGEVVEGLVLGP
jgi:hypothetical protein